MEDRYINDPRGQWWASSAKASSAFGIAKDKLADADGTNSLAKLVGVPDSNNWTNDNQEIGFDWLQASSAQPVNASEIRVVFDEGAGTVSKVELLDTDGKLHEVWSGLDDTQKDRRGYKTIDAVQLVEAG